LNQGYGWIFSPPSEYATVDVGMLLTQWAGVALVGAIGWFLAKDLPESAHRTRGVADWWAALPLVARSVLVRFLVLLSLAALGGALVAAVLMLRVWQGRI